MKLIDLKKQKFGRLTVIEYKGTSMWLCKCDCGKVTTVFRNNLVSGNTKSCGCLQLETLEKGRQGTHGMTDTRFYKIWRNLNQRCYLKSNIRFKFYGEKGIKCLWKSFEDFRDDMYESYLKHEKEFGTKQTTIDRIDNDGHYCKENCKWSNTSEQARNKNNNRLLTFKGNTKCVTEWSEILNISRVVIFSRLRLGWSINKILTTPIKN